MRDFLALSMMSRSHLFAHAPRVALISRSHVCPTLSLSRPHSRTVAHTLAQSPTLLFVALMLSLVRTHFLTLAQSCIRVALSLIRSFAHPPRVAHMRSFIRTLDSFAYSHARTHTRTRTHACTHDLAHEP
jgi:hypothetical protein